jgi:hypothetical protein
MPKKAGKQPEDTPLEDSEYALYNQTEPRNFAPRAGVPIPPPAFDIGRPPTRNHDGSQLAGRDFDPFLSPPVRGANIYGNPQSLMLATVPEDNQLALISRQAFYDQVPVEIRLMRSSQLNKLTEGPTAMPNQEAGLSSENFPFMEGTSQAMPVGHGVVKLKNVCPRIPFHF